MMFSKCATPYAPAGLGLHRRLRPATAAVRAVVICTTLCACMLRACRTASSAASTCDDALSLVPVVHTDWVCSARCMDLVYLQPRIGGVLHRSRGWAAAAAARQPRAGARPATPQEWRGKRPAHMHRKPSRPSAGASRRELGRRGEAVVLEGRGQVLGCAVRQADSARAEPHACLPRCREHAERAHCPPACDMVPHGTDAGHACRRAMRAVPLAQHGNSP